MVKRRKSRVPPPPSECPVSHCMRVLAGAWTAHVIWYLREGELLYRTSVGHQKVSARCSPTACASWYAKGSSPLTKPTSPPTVWYSLTPVGQELARHSSMS
jgi:DNA-binding HxlR family transcriptional regulator